jgi:UDP-glucose 4-epimerase
MEEDETISRVVVLDIEAPATMSGKSRFFDVDLTRPTAEDKIAEVPEAEGVETLVHLAFLASPTYAGAFAHELESVGTMQLLNACRRSRLRKFVMWSQTFLYGANPTNPSFLGERHPLRARRTDPFFADKMDAEADVLRFGRPGNARIVTVLRTAAILGPTTQNFLTRYLGHRVVPTLLGFNPLWQFVHEADAVAAFKLALDRDAPGVFNIVGQGVLRLSTVIKLSGRIALPLPRAVAGPMVGALWAARVSEAPPTLLDYLQYACVADGGRAASELGFSAVYTSREALIDYSSAQHLRDVELLSEAPA